MTSRHYDVIVLGRSLGALAAAAVLARRDFRVLLLGQGQHGQTYRFEEHVLCRRSFTLLAGSSPTWRRILHELAQSPQFRRRVTPLDPMFVVLSEGRRIEVPPDMEHFGREIEREFPEVRQLVDELYGSVATVNAAADSAFERDALWPPGSLWERFVAEAILPTRGSLTLLEAREAVLGTLRDALPFLDEHLLIVDSAHDGLALYDYRGGTRREVDRVHLRGATVGAEPMERLWKVEPAGYLEIAGEPIRGPIPNTYLVGKTVLPGLGQEGELIAAFGAAKLITRKDGARQKMRRQM